MPGFDGGLGSGVQGFGQRVGLTTGLLRGLRPGLGLLGNLGDLVNLIKAAGSWLTIANPYSSAEARLSARNGVTTGGACSSTQVVASVPTAHHGWVVRVGTGDSIPCDQPPPATPL